MPSLRGCILLLVLPALLASDAFLPTRASAQEVIFTAIPQTLQLIPRDESNTGLLRVAGSVTRAGHESVRLDVFRNRVPWRTVSAGLVYQNGAASFDLGVRIQAELADYDLHFYLDGVPEASHFRIVCGDVYLINGQSNARTTGGYSYTNEFIRSFGSSQNDPTALADSIWGIAQAQTTSSHCAVGTWGLEAATILAEAYGVPVAILNGAVGGTAISLHLRNDGDPMDPNTIYGRLLWRATKAGLRSYVKAILWHQGESDSYANWMDYRERFATLHTDWQEDFAPQKVYVFQIHPG